MKISENWELLLYFSSILWNIMHLVIIDTNKALENNELW